MLAVFACPPTLSKLESKILSMCRLNSISYVENGPDYYAGQNLASIGNVTRCNLLVSKAFLNNAGHSQVDSWIGWHVKGANLMFLGWTMYRCLSSKSVLDTWVSCSWGTLNFSFSQILYLCLSFPSLVQFSSVQSLSRVLFATPGTAARQASPSIANSRSLRKIISIESVMPSSHLPSSVVPFSSCLQSFPGAW